MDLINWIISQASKVYSWFGDKFYQLYSGALNAWTWAVTQASSALSAAKSYAYNFFQAVEDDISGLDDWASYQIGLLWNAVSGTVDNLYNQVIDFFDARLQDIWAFIQSVGDTAYNNLQSAYNSITGWVNQQIANVRTGIYNDINWLFTVKDAVLALVHNLTPTRILNLIKLADDLLGAIVLFFQNPLIFIFDMIWPYFLDFLGWVLAHALAADNTTITTPPWRD